MASTLKRKRVVVLVDENLVPPEGVKSLPKSVDEYVPYRTEFDVIKALRKLGHELKIVGLRDELAPLRLAINQFEPHVVFNLLEEFQGEAIHDAHVVGYLELKQMAYTGCNPRGLVLARDKALSKKVLTYHRIQTPKFAVFPRHRKRRRPGRLQFPLIVKSLIEEASYGIAQASVVTNDSALEERVSFIHNKIHTDAVVEEYIEGRELYAAVLGNHRRRVLPIWELFLDHLPDDAPKIATQTVKWSPKYQKKYKIRIGRARGLSEDLERHIAKTARRICRRLGTDGYVRVDFRLAEDGQLYFLEANPNPDIGSQEEFASAAASVGLKYHKLIERLVNLAIQRADKG